MGTKVGEVTVGTMVKPVMNPQNPPPKGTLGAGVYTAKHIIIATGARPRALPGLEHDNKLVWSYFDAMVPKEMPKGCWRPWLSPSLQASTPWAPSWSLKSLPAPPARMAA